MYNRIKATWSNMAVGKTVNNLCDTIADGTVFVSVLNVIYKLPLIQLGRNGNILAGVITVTSFLLQQSMFKKQNMPSTERSVFPINNEEKIKTPSESTRHIRKQLESGKWHRRIVTLKAANTGLGRFGLSHMPLFLFGKAGIDFINSENPTDVRNFLMMLYAIGSIYQGVLAFQQARATAFAMAPTISAPQSHIIDIPSIPKRRNSI